MAYDIMEHLDSIYSLTISDCNLDELNYTEKDREKARKRYDNMVKAKRKAEANKDILHNRCIKARDDAIRKCIANANFRSNLDEAWEALRKKKNICREAYV